MFISVLRFAYKGWIKDLYIDPEFYFGFFGFEWVKPMGPTGMYIVFGVMAISALCMALGLGYRFNATAFFLSFTYVELLDKTNYLNHYYFVSIIAFLMIWLPAHRAWSLDARISPSIQAKTVPAWTVNILKLQLGMVYFFAGIAKIHPDWLLEAMPLKLWLPANSDLPLIGSLLTEEWVAYAFAWSGAIYDLTIPFFLLNKRTRPMAYVAVIFFHIMTRVLFNIGMFPFIMILSTLIFFPGEMHAKWLRRMFGGIKAGTAWVGNPIFRTFAGYALGSFMLVQALLPFRYALYPGELFWNEEGFRFSWRVMLMEKAGYAEFRVKDKIGGETVVDPSEYLTPLQVKMMSFQPDMILQFAHYLEGEFKEQGMLDPEIRADVFVTLNGKGSRRFVDPARDLTLEHDGILKHRDWIIPMKESQYSKYSITN